MALILAKRILKAHPNGFVGATVEGRRGVGKSSYCIKIMKEVYKEYYGCSESKAYEHALKHVMFNIDDIIPVLKNARKNNEMIPVLCWDDAGVHGSSMQWFIDMHKINILKAMFDTVRSATTGLLLNCPDRGGLLKMLRSYDDYVVTISIVDTPYERSARGYNIYKLPSGMRRVYKNFEDRYSCYLPKKVYNDYMVMRNSYLDKAVAVMEDIQKKTGKKFELSEQNL